MPFDFAKLKHLRDDMLHRQLTVSPVTRPLAKIGAIDPTTNKYIIGAGKPNLVWVRILTGDLAGSNAKAWNFGKVANIANTPVDLIKNRLNEWQIDGVSAQGINEFQGSSGPLGVGAHTHHVDGPNPDTTQTRELLDGLVYPNPSGPALTLYVNSFKYKTAAGSDALFAGGTIDMTSYIPGGAGTKAPVKVGFDPVSAVLVAAAGTAVSVVSPLGDADVALILFTGYIPLTAVVLTNGQVTAPVEADFLDCGIVRAGPNATGGPFLPLSGGELSGSLTVDGRTTTKSGRNVAMRVVTAAGAVTMTNADDIVVVNKASGAATVVNLPTSPAKGDTYCVKDGKGDAATNNLTLTPASGTIDGASTFVININYGGVFFAFNGTEWNVTTFFSAGGSGTVTSVAITVPSDQAVSGSPITTSGTFAITDNTQSAHTVKAGPSSGGAATPGYRTLVVADLPSTAVIGPGSAVSNDFAMFNGTSGALIKDNSTSLSTDGTFGSNSDSLIPSQKATKTYVDAVAAGLSPKASVRLATVAALPSNVYVNGVAGVGATLTGVATGVLTVDGVTVALNDRLLIKDEGAPANNGIYQCTVAGAIGVAYVLTRTSDNNTSADIVGSYVLVEAGSTNASTGWVNTNTTTITIGTTAITWVKFSGSGGTVSSVGINSNASYLTPGGTPVTASGTLTLNKTTGLTGNQVVATPNGGTGVADLRALVDADLPTALAGHAITGGSMDNTPIGASTANTGKFSSVLIGSALDASAIVEFDSTTKGILFPAMTTTQRLAIGSPKNGLVVYDTTLAALTQYQGSGWVVFGTAGAGSLTVTDGTHSVANATNLNVTGGTVGGTTPNATLAINVIPSPLALLTISQIAH